MLITGLIGFVLLSGAWTEMNRPIRGPHGRLALTFFRSMLDSLPVQRSGYFWTSGRCAGCHGRDLLGQASIDPATGQDVNVVNDWRSTLMANSARDPFFRAKLDHEVLVNPSHTEALSNKCLSCHAPLAMHEERMSGRPPFTLAMLDTSVLANDGVSCLACHMQSPTSAGRLFSGDLHFDSAHVYGPYADDQIDPNIMESFVGFTPGFGAHMVNSAACAGCHTLITRTVDHSGVSTGDEFVEQATYHEWKNSVYSTNNVHCNTCHMPRIDGPIILAAEYAFLAGQTPYGLHHLVGANVHMLEIMKANREALGIPATEAHFDSTIARTRTLLTERTLDIDLEIVDRTADTAYFDLRLANRAGHRFPSGYPSRRAFIRFVVRDTSGDTLFASGGWDDTFEVHGHDVPYEPHYDVIRDEGQVQIYELVMADVNGAVTTVLERAKDPLKDNRLVPIGFTRTHTSYDTTRIAGHVMNDPDFNHTSTNEEGSGTDIVHYHIPVSGVVGALYATASVFYQAMPPAWNAEMFSFSSPRIDTFRTMLQQSDGTPLLVASDSIGIGPLGIPRPPAQRVVVLPNPTSDGYAEIRYRNEDHVVFMGAYDARGRAFNAAPQQRNGSLVIMLPEIPGLYFIHLRVNGNAVMQRIIRR